MFSIVVPIYHGTTSIELARCISSIENQTYKNYELILVLDGLVMPDVIKLISELTFKKIVLQLKDNSGPGIARNEGVKYASFDLIVIMDSDDFSIPERLDMAHKTFSNTNADIYCSSIQEFDFKLNKALSIKRGFPYKNPYKIEYLFSPINNVSVIIKKETLLRLGGYPNLKYGEDFVLWAKALISNTSVHHDESITVLVDISNGFNKRRLNDFFIKEIALLKMLRKAGYFNLYHCASRLMLRMIQRVIQPLLGYRIRLIISKM